MVQKVTSKLILYSSFAISKALRSFQSSHKTNVQKSGLSHSQLEATSADFPHVKRKLLSEAKHTTLIIKLT